MIDSKQVKKLREITGTGMMNCKEALKEANGDIEEAIKVLRQKGLSESAKRESRLAIEGVIESYIHAGSRLGVILELNCETDFVAKTIEFKELAKDISMHIAAANPKYISINKIPDNILNDEKKIFEKQLENEGKSKEIIDKIIKGKLNKYYKEVCLLEQIFIKDSDKTIKQLINEKTIKIGEKIEVRRFIRYELGSSILDTEKNKK